MPPILTVIGVTALVFFGFYQAMKEMQRVRSSWQIAAAKLRLEASEARLRLDGQRMGHRVEVDASGGKNARTSFMVHGVPQHLLIRAESIATALGKLVAGEDIECGDELFDGKILVRSSSGRNADAQALLSAKVRVAVAEFIAHGGVIEHGYLLLRRNGIVKDPDRLVSTIETMVELAGLLSERSRMNAAESLADIVKDDSSPKVRFRAIKTLVSAFDPASPYVRHACRIAASSDSSPATRMAAAIALGKEGVPALRKIVESGAANETRAEALESLCELVTKEEALGIIGTALSDSADEVRARAAKTLRGLSAPSLLDALTRSARDPSLTDEWVAWHAEAIANTRRPEAEPALLSLLEKEVPVVRVAAAKGLGRIGSRLAVEKLLPLTQGLTLDGAVKTAARDAIAAIQSRLAGAGAGQLAISEDEQQGALSEPQTPGALTLLKKQTTKS